VNKIINKAVLVSFRSMYNNDQTAVDRTQIDGLKGLFTRC